MNELHPVKKTGGVLYSFKRKDITQSNIDPGERPRISSLYLSFDIERPEIGQGDASKGPWMRIKWLTTSRRKMEYIKLFIKINPFSM